MPSPGSLADEISQAAQLAILPEEEDYSSPLWEDRRAREGLAEEGVCLSR